MSQGPPIANDGTICYQPWLPGVMGAIRRSRPCVLLLETGHPDEPLGCRRLAICRGHKVERAGAPFGVVRVLRHTPYLLPV